MIRVLLADDQPLLRAGFRALLDSEPDIVVVAEVGDGAAAAASAVALLPDVAVLDVRMPEADGIEATRRITRDERLARVRVLILTNYALDEYVFAALRAGASGFLVKDSEPEELVQAVRTVAVGEALLSPTVTRQLIDEFVARPGTERAAPELDVLTAREREVVALVAQGMSNDQIAEAMVISPTTAKTHVSRSMIKLGARDRAQLVVFAYEGGLVRPRRPPEG